MAAKTQTGIKLACPKCGDANGLVVRVNEMTVECTECSEEITRAELRQVVAEAQRLLRWLDMAEEA